MGLAAGIGDGIADCGRAVRIRESTFIVESSFGWTRVDQLSTVPLALAIARIYEIPSLGTAERGNASYPASYQLCAGHLILEIY